ncbi:hypothetical protein AVEN_230394-1 [Araneus ventricosus]|uniref:Tc1-like transposase DDE domain-containing protein n=1 Tax=Araneus ventricosus TaxID=182803 RepID=A0A4Y2EQ99_ARAVE|nr:hypothetical protein AVEN_230394-1 [Araneus ventricosus]
MDFASCLTTVVRAGRQCKYADAAELLKWQDFQEGDLACSTLARLREAFQRKHPGNLSDIILLHDNTRPILLAAAKVQIGSLESPSYSPNLAPSDYLLFPKLKEHFSGTSFSSNSDVKKAAENC